MKTKPFVLLLIVLLMAGCQPKIQTDTVDIAAAEDAVSVILDNFHKAMMAGNVENIMSFLNDEGLYCGTDPTELWDKESLSKMMAESMADTSLVFDYSVDKRKISVDVDGNTALVLEQFSMSALSEKMPIRLITHFVNTEDVWMMEFFSWSFVPYNEDLAKLNAALEKKESQDL